jgi:hydroxybutyrate-dimer hydrolase
MYRFATNAVAVTYANTYGRFGVAENLCGFSFANTSAVGVVIPPNPVLEERIFGRGNGVPPILADPPASDLIVMDQQTLVIPD